MFNRKIYLIVLLIISFFAICILFCMWLYKDNSINADILVVEGWLPDYALKQSIKKFYAGKYKVMVTIGTQMPISFRIHSLGTLIFNLENILVNDSNKVVKNIAVNAHGSKADKEYPHFRIYLNDSLIGESYVNQKNKIYKFYINKKNREIKTIKIQYDNDGYNYWRDRDLYVDYISLDNYKIQSHSKFVYYDMNKINDYRQFEPGFDSNADYSAFILKKSGFNDSIIAVTAQSFEISRTYSSALYFKKWYLNSQYKDKSVNIISLGPHTRRTWMVYKKVLGKDTDVGIILVNSEDYNKNNWWKSLTGIRSTFHEMLSYIYTVIVLPISSKGLK